MKISYQKYELKFKRPAGTSRGVYRSRPVWYVFIEQNGICGIGECAPLPGLSTETPEDIEKLLQESCSSPAYFIEHPEFCKSVSSLKFAFEMALLDLKQGGQQILFPSAFTDGKAGIPINGLIWMGDFEFMKAQIKEKLDAGFGCLKLKIGALNFNAELELLKSIRKEYSADELTLRVDANGAFSPNDAKTKLAQLSGLELHSIEQPIAANQWDEMAQLCATSTLPIALDEELIGIYKQDEKIRLLDKIKPQFLILKPSLHGGFSGCNEWIELAEKHNIDWWITSYLESNVGLNALAQWTFTKNVSSFQGLGTGQLFTNNFDSPLEIQGDKLWYESNKNFQLPSAKWI